MPDISMCKGTGCEKKDTCYRYRAVPNDPWQTYSAFWDLPRPCTYYVSLLPGDKIRGLIT